MERLLRDRMEQLEKGEGGGTLLLPKSEEEREADIELEKSTEKLRMIATDGSLDASEKIAAFEKVYKEVSRETRSLEGELTLVEKQLRKAEAECSKLHDELRRAMRSIDKLKKTSRELAAQNKTIDSDDEMEGLKRKFAELEVQYEERELEYREIDRESEDGDNDCNKKVLEELEKNFKSEKESLFKEKRNLKELEETTKRLKKKADANEAKMKEYEKLINLEELTLEKERSINMKKLSKSIAEMERVKETLEKDEESLKKKTTECADNVRQLNSELDFWKSRSKSESEKRQSLEKLCRTLTTERTVLRKEVQAMQSAWVLLENEIESLRSEMAGGGDDDDDEEEDGTGETEESTKPTVETIAS